MTVSRNNYPNSITIDGKENRHVKTFEYLGIAVMKYNIKSM